VTHRIGAIVQALRTQPDQSMTGIARSTRLPLSTVHRLVNELVECQIVARSAEGRYRLGAELSADDDVEPTPGASSVVGPILNDFATATGLSLRFGIVVGTSGVSYMDLSASGSGRLYPTHATASGKAVLAYSPADLVADTLARGLPAYTIHTLVTPEQLKAALVAIRTRGLALCYQEWEYGMLTAAAPVLGPEGVAVGALEVSLRKVRDLPRITPALIVTARILSRVLAARRPQPQLMPRPRGLPPRVDDRDTNGRDQLAKEDR
jgi:DNA-binding IclR family transcriptional regulator